MDVILFAAFLLCLDLATGRRTEVRVVAPSVVRRGATVTLLCLHNLAPGDLYSVKWYRGTYEFYRYLPKERPPARVFTLPGLEVDTDGSSGQQVTVRVLSRRVGGRFTCEASADQPTFSTASDSADLQVVDLGLRRPLLRLGSSVHVVGDPLVANCSAQPTVPPPTISFYVDDVKVNSSLVRSTGRGEATLELRRLGRPEPEIEPKPEPEVAYWVRCEAEVAGVYQLSSAGVPVLERAPPLPTGDAPGSGVSGPYHTSVLLCLTVVQIYVHLCMSILLGG